jgi:Domain of unknown function (DUF4129)
MALLSRLSTRRSGTPFSSARIAVALAALLALVAVVAAGHHRGSAHGSRPSQAFFDYLLSGFLVFMTVGAVALVYLLWQERDEGFGARDPDAQRKKAIATVAALLVFMLVLVIAREAGFRPRAFFHRTTVHHVATKPAHAKSAKPLPAVERRFRWLPAALVGGFFVAIVLFAAYAKARRRVEAEDAREAAEEVAAALDDSVDDLRAEPDARRAIIAAYARMERALGAVGMRREPSEAPLEYLARALEGLKASGVSVRRLTELFRVAKFSDHTLGPQDKEHAIAALLTVRDELRAEA